MKSRILISAILSAGVATYAVPEASAKPAKAAKRSPSTCKIGGAYLPAARTEGTAAHAGSQRRARAAAVAGSDVGLRVRKLVAEHLGVDATRLRNETRLIKDLCADSLDVVELVMAAEEEFGIEIPDDAAERITTIGDAIAYVRKRVSEGAS